MSTAGRYRNVTRLGEGTYGVVYKGVEKDTGRAIAFKRMLVSSDDEGVPGTAIREICLLKQLRHDNIVSLYEVLFEWPKVTLIFELCDCDLKQYLEGKTDGRLDAGEAGPVMKQLFSGLAFLHEESVVHRDLKPQNIFLNKRPVSYPAADGRYAASVFNNNNSNNNNNILGEPLISQDEVTEERLIVKLGDFGLARVENIPVKKYSHEVVTLWYRSPDVLMGSALYSFPVDIWSMGTILFEMVTGRVLFGGRNEDDQLLRMVRLLGSPTRETWPSMRSYPGTSDRLDRVAALANQQRAAMAAAEESNNATNTNTTNSKNEAAGAPRRRQAAQGFTEFYRQRHVPANPSARSSANSLRLPPELWCPTPLFHEYMAFTGFQAAVGDDGVDLLHRCLAYEPQYRITSSQALQHPFLTKVSVPPVGPIDDLVSALQQSLISHGL